MTALLPIAWVLAANPGWVIPPGQEDLTLAMTKFDPPVAGCKLEAAKVELDQIKLDYLCGADPRQVTLRHKDNTDDGTVLFRTEQFSIAPGEPSPPGELLVELEKRVRASEAGFVWTLGEERPPTPITPTAPPPSLLPPPGVDRAESRKKYEEGFKLFNERRHDAAYQLFLELARRDPAYPGVLGMVVANLAPLQPNDQRVKELAAEADANRDDTLRQFVAGVAAHYSAHYQASSREEKQRLYKQSIEYLSRTRPAFDFEPRVFIYLAVSHFRLGMQKEAEALIEQAIALKSDDPDAYYCRAEINQRVNVDQALADIAKYLELTKKFEEHGSVVAEGKIDRVKKMAAHLEAVKRGEVQPAELWDPLSADGAGEPRKSSLQTDWFANLVFAVGALFAVGAAVFLVSRRRRA